MLGKNLRFKEDTDKFIIGKADAAKLQEGSNDNYKCLKQDLDSIYQAIPNRNVHLNRFQDGPIAYLLDSFDKIFMSLWFQDFKGLWDEYTKEKTQTQKFKEFKQKFEQNVQDQQKKAAELKAEQEKDQPKRGDGDDDSDNVKKNEDDVFPEVITLEAIKQLIATMEDKSVKPQTIITIYGGSIPDALTQREFAYWLTVEAIKTKSNKISPNATKNFQKTLDSIYKFWSLVDISHSEAIDSFKMYKSLKNINAFEKVGSTWVNGFVLKVMDINTSTIDLKDFAYGVMMGQLERQCPKNNCVPNRAFAIQKAARKAKIDNGNAPK